MNDTIAALDIGLNYLCVIDHDSVGIHTNHDTFTVDRFCLFHGHDILGHDPLLQGAFEPKMPLPETTW